MTSITNGFDSHLNFIGYTIVSHSTDTLPSISNLVLLRVGLQCLLNTLARSLETEKNEVKVK